MCSDKHQTRWDGRDRQIKTSYLIVFWWILWLGCWCCWWLTKDPFFRDFKDAKSRYLRCRELLAPRVSFEALCLVLWMIGGWDGWPSDSSSLVITLKVDQLKELRVSQLSQNCAGEVGGLRGLKRNTSRSFYIFVDCAGRIKRSQWL